jgi:ribosomal protein S18 acetylase RimI-like enzyme
LNDAAAPRSRFVARGSPSSARSAFGARRAKMAAMTDGFLIGFLSQDRAAEGYIHFVGVAPDERRRGTGRRLYVRFFATCRAAGRDCVRCVTSPTNTLSIAFHEAMGFAIERSDGELAKPDYDGPGVPRVAFVRSTAAR